MSFPGKSMFDSPKMKSIPESKLKAFSIGTMNAGKKALSKKEQEDLRRKADEEATAQVYQEFLASFEDSGKHGKTWVKGGLVNPEKGKDSPREQRERLYKPTSKLAELASTFQSTKEEQRREEEKNRMFAKKREEKKKSNLELFKEELKQIQEERQERHKLKRSIRDGGIDDSPNSPSEKRLDAFFSDVGFPKGQGDSARGSFDPGDENTTNIYVGNINPKMTEKELCEAFGKYGPLASVKIMWPRTDEERSRGRNCGFVAFMNRKDGERAMNTLRGKDVMGFEMKLGWGKGVPIPPHPVYIPPALAEMTMPPPPSGLPFNAQPHRRSQAERKYGSMRNRDEKEDLEKTLANAVVKVVIPTERNLLCLIHRMIEFVVREGPMFEAMIMNREINNPMFRFLFENQTPAHIYYRWKLFTILQGDSPYRWRTEGFKMFRGGSVWKPPPMNPYTQGMPEELVGEDDSKKGQLSDSQRDRLEDMLRELTPERPKVGDAMVWCLDHAESAEEIVECITESLSILETPIPKKIARLFLVSDILFNSSAKVPNASFFRKCFQTKLRDIFKDVHKAYEKIDGRLKAEQFKQKVMGCFRAWEDWAVYPNDFLITLQNVFLGLVPTAALVPAPQPEVEDSKELDLDGAPLEDLDGAPIEGVKVSEIDGKPIVDYDGDVISEDLDGEPLDKDVDGKPMDDEALTILTKFTKSKWETVDQSELEAQAVTTSKWDLLDPEADNDDRVEEEDEDMDGQPMEEQEGALQSLGQYGSPLRDDSLLEAAHKQYLSEERRAKLREIELKVVKYQDELENGKRSRKSGMTIAEQVQHYRRKLLQKESRKSSGRSKGRDKDDRKRERERERDRERRGRSESSDSNSDSESSPRSRRLRRSPSPSLSYSSHRSLSPKRSKRSKSPKRGRRSRSRSRSPYFRDLSRSPLRHKHKHKKKHRE
ncbi:U2 snRNP-associated SURP motif-containing protein-like isoform X2 [Liolophura sinensis]|uniref:U2 snRNP-associated SURP motif-containing protein-like isoform X2 n=1 Tax=Liolophura sinensis TaxID=3198878 RepID=UPI0031582442